MVTVNMMMCRPSSFFLFWFSFSHTSPKYMIGSAQICSGTRWLLKGSWIVVLGSLTSFSLLEANYFPGGKACENTKFRISYWWSWGRLPRAAVVAPGPLEVSQGQVGWGMEQAGIVEGVPAQGRGRMGWALSSLPSQTIPGFCEIVISMMSRPPQCPCCFRQEGSFWMLQWCLQLFHSLPSHFWPCITWSPLDPILPQCQVPLHLIDRLSGQGWLILPHYSSSFWIWEPFPPIFT